MAEPVLALAGVAKVYPGVTVLKDVNLTADAGESLAIVGPSGCGKSTLLNIVGALLEPTQGTVRINGRELATLDPVALADLRNREIGYVFQAHHLLPQCSALENVLVPSLVHPDRSSAKQRGRALLERVGLAERMDHRPAELSGGERQRVALVRALINQPKLVLADEPTGALDGEAARDVGDLLATLADDEGAALVVVTHADDLAARMGRTVTLTAGTLTA